MFRKHSRYIRESILGTFLIYTNEKTSFQAKSMNSKKYWNTGVTAPAKIALVRLFLFTASKKIGLFVSFLLYFWMLIRENHLVHLLTKDKENGITWKNKRVNIQEITTPHKQLRKLMELLRVLKILCILCQQKQTAS